MSLNWEWALSDMSKLSTVVYGSWGRGGGTGEIGRINGRRQFQLKTDEGLIPVQDIYNWNSGGSVPDFGDDRTQYNNGFYNTGNNGHPDGGGRSGSDNGISRRASMNSHNWYGTIINFNTELNEYFNLDLGLDLRTYTGLHYRVVNDVLGADGYVDYDNINDRPNFVSPNQFVAAKPSWNPFQNIKDQEKIDYNNDGKVNWSGVFGQLEYSKDKISAFVQASVSNQGFKRIDYFNYVPAEQETETKNFLGGNVKTGLNYNINDNHNVFFNTGFYSKQPKFDAVWINFGNNFNESIVNEKVLGFELGYGYRSQAFNANVNLYRTSWKDRFISQSVTFNEDTPEEVRGSANYQGVTEIHSGIELDFVYRPSSRLTFNGMVSYGDWIYEGNVQADVFDNDQNFIGSSTLYLDDVKVGDAAQFTANAGLRYKVWKDLRIGGDWTHAGNLYADINPEDFDTEGKESLKLPSYDLFDLRADYTFDLGKGKTLRVAATMNNVFNTKYMSRSATNTFASEGDDTYQGINTRNRVYFGWGRSWNTSVKFRF
jgi:hypothetical protein